MIKVKIERCLAEGGRLLWYVTCRTHFIERAWDTFYTLKKLKEFYGIKKIKKTGEQEWATGRRKNYYWENYTAEIDEKYITRSAE